MMPRLGAASVGAQSVRRRPEGRVARRPDGDGARGSGEGALAGLPGGGGGSPPTRSGLPRLGWMDPIRGVPEVIGGGQQRRRRTPEPADLDMRRCCVGPDLWSYRPAVLPGACWRQQGRQVASLLRGGRRSEYGHWPMPRTELRHHDESCVPWTNDGNAFGRRILSWKCLSIGSLPFAQCVVPRCNALTFWSGNGGVASLLGGVALEARACQSVMVVTVAVRKVEV
jgi:hypothetical protein